MSPQHDSWLTQLAVRITTIDKSLIGSGLLYAAPQIGNKVYILTAAHCLYQDKDTCSVLRQRINLEFYNTNTKSYIAYTCEINTVLNGNVSHLGDVAVFVLPKSAVAQCLQIPIPLIFAIKERSTQSEWLLKGFPTATNGKELDCLQLDWKQEQVLNQCFQLGCPANYSTNDDASYQVEGLSGSGVFQIVGEEIYLYGILTRFRDAGKVFSGEYVAVINKLLEQHFLPTIEYTFLGEEGMNPLFFQKHIDTAIENLGPRFNNKINFKLPIAQSFDDISQNVAFRQRFTSILHEFVSTFANGDLKREIIEHQQYVKNFFDNLKWDASVKFDLETILNPTQMLWQKGCDKLEALHQLHGQVVGKLNETNPYNESIRNLRRCLEAIYQLKQDLECIEMSLVNGLSLLIKGQAGAGKSHLLGDVARRRIEQQLPTVLILGQRFKELDVKQTILNEIDLKCTFETFLKTLNHIGQQIGSRVLLMIDAINEGNGVAIWSEQLGGLIKQLENYPHIGLVLTVRDIYFDELIPEHLYKKLVIKQHNGFQGNEYAAFQLFCEHYELHQPSFPLLSQEFSNPLLLHLICQGATATAHKTFPQGLCGLTAIFNFYLEAVEKKLKDKRVEYRSLRHRNKIRQALNAFAILCLESDYYEPTVEKAVELFDNQTFKNLEVLIDDLIYEGILIRKRLYQEDTICFAYQRMGDFLVAESLLAPLKNAEEVKIAFETDSKLRGLLENLSSGGILDMLAILLPEKYELEIMEVYTWVPSPLPSKSVETLRDTEYIASRNFFENNIFIPFWNSLEWRSPESIDNDKIAAIIPLGYLSWDDLFQKLFQLATIIRHPLNGDNLHKRLFQLSMSKRDACLLPYLLYYSSDAYPVKRLIHWAWQPDISTKVGVETARLAGQTLAWILASTHKQLRDQATKAMVNLLEEQPDALLNILKAFENIDDMYIAERLYAVAYGCVLRTQNEALIQRVAQWVFDTIFKKGQPPTHPLLRDYARNIIEYAIYKNMNINVNVALIRPPYNSQMPQKMPTTADMQKYNYETEEATVNWRVYASATYGDFGKYAIGSALEAFKLKNFKTSSKFELDESAIQYWIVEEVFKLGYDAILHKHYDTSRIVDSYYKYAQTKIDTISIKYQRIAFYDILGRITDNYKYKDNIYNIKPNTFFQGTWQMYLRDIDPTFIHKTVVSENRWWKMPPYTYWNQPKWLDNSQDLPDPALLISVMDSSVQQCLYLKRFFKWTVPSEFGQKEAYNQQLWYFVDAYIVRKREKKQLFEYLQNQSIKRDFMPSISHPEEIFSRENYWAAQSQLHLKPLWRSVKKTTPKVMLTTQEATGELSGDKSEVRPQYDIPCRTIIEGMHLWYAKLDGCFKDIHGKIVAQATDEESDKGVFIEKEDFLLFLESNQLDVIWCVWGEKQFSDSQNRWSEISGVYAFEDGELKGQLKLKRAG